MSVIFEEHGLGKLDVQLPLNMNMHVRASCSWSVCFIPDNNDGMSSSSCVRVLDHVRASRTTVNVTCVTLSVHIRMLAQTAATSIKAPHISVYTCVCMYIHICTHLCMCGCACVQLCKYMCMHTSAHMYIHIYRYTHLYIYIYIYTHMRIYSFTYVYICMYVCSGHI